TVADQDEIAHRRALAHPLPHGGDLLRLPATVPEEVPQRVPALGPTEGQLRGLQAAAPGARQDQPDWNVVGLKRGPGAPRLGSALIAEVSLRRAVLEAEVRRIPGAGRGRAVPQQHHLTPGA